MKAMKSAHVVTKKLFRCEAQEGAVNPKGVKGYSAAMFHCRLSRKQLAFASIAPPIKWLVLLGNVFLVNAQLAKQVSGQTSV